LNRITIPRNTLVLLVGPAGCGKSSFAARHFWPTQIVSSDDCRALISDDPGNQGVTGLAFELMHSIIAMRLRLGRLTVADATSLKREDRRPLMKLARRFGFNTAAFVFNIPLEVCLTRNARRERVVPATAIALQYGLLTETLASILREGCRYVWTLDEAAVAQADVKVTRWVRPAAFQPAAR
jgi:protein phosphatase